MTHATTILQIFLTSPKPVVRFGAIRTLNTSLGLGSFQYTGPENERMSPENEWLVQMLFPIKVDPFLKGRIRSFAGKTAGRTCWFLAPTSQKEIDTLR